MSGDIVKTRNVTQTAECGPEGLWTTVVASCVYVEFNEVSESPAAAAPPPAAGSAPPPPPPPPRPAA
jgi:hypothetical protein